MGTTLLTVGLACIIGAIIGGGFRAFGMEMPVIPSIQRQTGLALIGILLLVASYKHDSPAPVTASAGKIAADECNNVPSLKLNEICADGRSCDGREDFVEIYNPNDSQVDLGCFAIVNKKQHRKPLSGTLNAKAVRAWNHNELGFGVAKEDGEVSLMRAHQGGGESSDDSRDITDSQSYQQRVPDGGDWQVMSVEDVKKAGTVGSIGEPNKGRPPELQAHRKVHLRTVTYGFAPKMCNPEKVTAFIARTCDDLDECDFVVNNDKCPDGDPAPGDPKSMNVAFDCSGKSMPTKSALDYQHIVLSCK